MNTKSNQSKILPYRKLTIACALALALPAAMAENEPRAPAHAAVWERWQPLAEGYVARRRVPAGLELPVEARRAPQTQPQERGRSASANKRGNNKEKTTASRVRLAADGRTEPTTAAWLYTEEAGLHSVTLSDLAAQTGLDIKQLRSKAKRGRLSLTNAGVSVAWTFDPANDRVLFTAEVYETFQTEGNAYRIEQTQSRDPQRMSKSRSKKQVPAGAPTPFREVLHFEEEGDMMYFTWLDLENPEARYWFWDYLYGTNKPQIAVPLSVPDPAAEGTAQLRVGLHGYTDIHPGDDHQVVATLNGVQVGTLSWDGLTEVELVAQFDQGLLDPVGENSLILHGSQGGQMLAWVEVTYDRLPEAREGQIWLRDVAGGVQTVSGLASRDILVIESPLRDGVVRRDVRKYRSGNGWAVDFQAKPGSDYLIAEASAAHTPVIDARAQADLRAGDNAADYLIIAPREFSATAEALAAYRRASYGAVTIAWLDDIYKSFGAGRKEPYAIGQFMDHVRSQWAAAPAATVVVGKGSLDRKNVMGFGDNFVPVLMTANPWRLAESDARLLGVEDGIAPFAFGRLPITNDSEGLAYVEKLIAHEQQLGSDASHRAVVAADNPDEGGDFHTDIAALDDQLMGLAFQTVTRLAHPTDPVRTTLTQSATWDAGFLSYTGHGWASQFGDHREKFLTAEDAASLQNDSYPVVSALTCSAGSDAYPGVRSVMATLVLNPQGGAITTLAATSLSLNSEAQALGGAFVDHLYGGGSNVGEALASAKEDTREEISAYMAPMYSITGDPVTQAR